MPTMLLATKNRLLAGALALGLGSACETNKPPSIQPEPVDTMVLHESYAELLITMLTALRTGDLPAARASVASEGQIEMMCPGYLVGLTPYSPPSVEVASAHCREVFAPIPDADLEGSLNTHEYGVNHQPAPDDIFAASWRDRCSPDFEVFQIYGIFEVHGEGLPQAGFEVSHVFRYRGKWGLMSIPRCRGEGE